MGRVCESVDGGHGGGGGGGRDEFCGGVTCYLSDLRFGLISIYLPESTAMVLPTIAIHGQRRVHRSTPSGIYKSQPISTTAPFPWHPWHQN